MRKYTLTSVVWNYFQKTKRGAICNTCKLEFACFGNTSNLMKHLRRRHKELLHSPVQRPESYEDSVDYEENEIISEQLENQGSTLNNIMATQQPEQDKSLFSFYTNGEGPVHSEEEHSEPATEAADTAVHTIQAYRDVNGTTFLYLHPAADGEHAVQIQNAAFQPVVATSETITANGEVVSVAVQKEGSVLEGQSIESEAKTPEEVTSRRIVHAPVKNYQGSSVGTKAVFRQVQRPSPVRTTSHSNYNNNNSSTKEDSYEAFGKYIASMLRNLPSKTACKLQGEIVNWILKEQIKNNS